MRLGSVSTVRSGLVLARKQARQGEGMRYPVLNLRCIRPDGTINTDEIDVFHTTELLAPEYLTHIGDIVLRLTAPYTAVLIDEGLTGIVISSSFVIIRTDKRQLMPEYLFWFLNTSDTKRIIYDNATGSMIGAIKPKYFTEFEVDLLPMDDQRQIATLNCLARKEVQLLAQLAEQKKNYYDKVLEKIHHEMKRG